MMQLGFVSAILPELTLEEVFATGKEAGYNSVELMCWPPGKADRRYAGVTHIDVTGFGPAEAAHVRNLADSYGMSIAALSYYPNILSPDHEEGHAAALHLKKVIDAAKTLGIGIVGAFIGRDWTKSVDENWPRFKAIWPDLISYAEDQGIKVAIENCPMLFTADEWPGGKNLASSPAIWQRMFTEIPNANFGLNYDPSHLLWQQMDYIAPLKEFASRIFRVHLKDAAINRDRLNQVGVLAYPLEFHSPALPGLGDIDWARFIDAVDASGYQGTVCVEVEDKRYEGTLEKRKEALTITSQYLRKTVRPGLLA